ncbi:hypothetical protein E8E11_010558 [Didymella keratinophila]|nr:hypothetical protein E8E11_010558 [Didymella keratinophila]
MDLYEPLSSGEEDYLEPILVDFPPILTRLPYTPLDNTQNEIRLLNILPINEDSARVCCLMDTHCLDDELVYSALSYTWGAENIARGVIVVNDHSALVTKNLSDALHRLRDDGVHKVWVDAICIDQGNKQEKAHQVQKMGMIYRMASTVLSWIGPEDEDSDRGMQVMSRIAAIARSLRLQSVFDPYIDNHDSEERGRIMGGICGALKDDSWLKEGDLQRAIHLTSRDYWRRLWVIQEVNLAKYALILCGKNQIMWDQFLEGLTLLSWLPASSVYRLSGHDAFAASLSRIFQLDGFVHWSPPPAAWIGARLRSNGRYGMQLFHLMDETCNDTILQASDPRDRIYALLGLVDEDDQSQISIDYASPVPAVFRLPSKDVPVLKRLLWRTLLYGHYPPSLSEEELDSSFEDYLENSTCTEFIRSIMPAPPGVVAPDPPIQEQGKEASNERPTAHQSSSTFQCLLDNNKHARSIFVTENGSIGSGPVMTREGDVLCAIPGCEIPFLLRRGDGQENDGSWKLIAPVYVDGMVSTAGDGYFTMDEFWATDPDVQEILLG